MMKHLQKLGKAMMLPVAALPICGILMGLGYALAPAAMGAAGATEGFAYVLGVFLIKAGAALIDNMAILFAIGVGVGLTKDNDGTAGLAGMVSYLMMTTLLNPGTVGTIAPGMVASQVNSVAFAKVGGKENVASIDHCITRLRLEVKDRLLVDENKIKSSGASGVVRPGKTAVQVIIGPKVQFVHDEFKKLAN